MKRKLSLLLAVVMILGSFSMAFAAEEEVDPAKFLEKEGILVGNKSGDLMLDEPLLRRDAVVILSRLMKAEDEAKDFKEEGLPTFKDITDKYYTPYLAWAQSNKYIKGHTEEKFGFNDNLTTKEFATVLLRALGYIENAEDWDKVFDEAKKLGILEGVEKEADAELIRREVAQMIYNALGVKMKDSDKTLAEFLGIKMPEPDVLEVVDVRAENLKEIIVELSNAKLVKNQEKLEDAVNYRTSAGKILDAKLVDNEIRLLLDGNDAMEQNKKYTLSIQDLDKELNGKYEFVAYDNTAPEVEEVKVLGTKGIRVAMSEPIKEAKERDFQLDGKKFVMRVRVNGRDVTLIPYRQNAKFEEGKHELTVGQLTDYAGFKSKEEKFDIEIAEDATKPVVKKITAKNNSVVVEFEQEVHPDSISKTNVSWSQPRGRKVIEADDAKILTGNRVEYIFGTGKELPKPEVEITVKDVENYSGYAMDPYTEIVRVEVDYSRPEITRWRLLEDDRIEIVFSKPLDKASAEKVGNYTLYKDAVKDANKINFAVKNAVLEEDGKTVIVEFYSGVLEQGNRYVLNVKDVTDNTALKNVMIEEDLEFVYGVAEGLEVLSAYTTKVSKRDNATAKITLVFSNQLVREEAENLRNYELKTADNKWWAVEVLSKDARVELYDSGYKVDIFLPGNGKVVKEIRLSRAIRDLDGNRVKDTEIKLDEPRTKAVKAELTKDDEIVLKFNQKVTLVDKEKALEKITLDKGTITGIKEKDGNIILTVSLSEEGIPKEVKVEAGDYILNMYDELGILKAEVEVVDVRAAKIEGVTVTRTEEGKGIVKVTFTNALDPKTVEGLRVKIGDGKPVALENISGTDFKEFKAEVDLPEYEEGKEVKVDVEVLTVGVKDLAGNSVKGKEFKGVEVDVENYEDKVAANAVIAKINALPAVDKLTLNNKEEVEAARAAYNALTDTQKALVPEDVLQKLEAAEAKIEELEDSSPEASFQIKFVEMLMGGGEYYVTNVVIPGKSPAKYKVIYKDLNGNPAETDIVNIGESAAGFYQENSKVTIVIYDENEVEIHRFEDVVVTNVVTNIESNTP